MVVTMLDRSLNRLASSFVTLDPRKSGVVYHLNGTRRHNEINDTASKQETTRLRIEQPAVPLLHVKIDDFAACLLIRVHYYDDRYPVPPRLVHLVPCNTVVFTAQMEGGDNAVIERTCTTASRVSRRSNIAVSSSFLRSLSRSRQR